MKNEEKIKKFVDETDDDELKDYSDKLFDSLKEMNDKEDKFLIWFVLILLFYLLSKSSHVESIDLGMITLTDISVIAKLLPLGMAYIFFNMMALSNHKQDVMMALNIISEKKFNKEPLKRGDKSFSSSLIIRLFFPYSFSNAFSGIETGKSSIVHAILGFFLIIPTLLLVFIPYAIYIFMIVDVYRNYTDDMLGWISFLGSTWVFLLILIFMSIKARANK